jgi:hypothetical protein
VHGALSLSRPRKSERDAGESREGEKARRDVAYVASCSASRAGGMETAVLAFEATTAAAAPGAVAGGGGGGGVVRLKRSALAACLTCPLCGRLLRDAATITECLHTCEYSLTLARSANLFSNRRACGPATLLGFR